MLKFVFLITKLLKIIYSLIILHNISYVLSEKSTIQLNYCSKIINNNENCDCYPLLSTYEINCPSIQPKLLVRVKWANYIQIECKHVENFDLIPSMNLDNIITKMNIRYCPVPQNYTMEHLLKRLNIEKLKKLSIELDDTVDNITSNYLKGLTSLNDLHLKVSALTVISPDLFSSKGLNTLRALIISGNDGVLPIGLFKNLKNLNSLMLTTFKQIYNGTFHKLHHLSILRLINNHLEQITNDLFKDNANLNELDLRNNRIKYIEVDSFKSLINLKQLTLKGNFLQNLPENLFEYNRELIQFSLSYCGNAGMKSLPYKFLANLFKLETVQISCKVKFITKYIFKNSTAINQINLAFNKFETLPNALFETQYNLTKLDLGHNHLEKLPDHIFEFNIHLIELNLSYNRLKSINSQLFITLTKLQHLDISHNDLITINTCAFQNNGNLKDLYLNNNRLTLESSVHELLENHNVAEKMTSPFTMLYRLEHLDLSHNSIRYIYEDWRLQLPKLQELNLSYNNITILDFNRLEMIKQHELYINLQYNQLKRLLFKNLTKELQQFQLQFENKIILDLNYNSIKCDCQLVDFLRSLKDFENNEKLLLHLNYLKCSEPLNLKGKLVQDIDAKELLCTLDVPGATIKICPNKCQCWIRTYDLTLLIYCNSTNLRQFPELPSVKKLHLNQIELYLDNNYISALPESPISSDYDNIIKLSLFHNNLTKIQYDHLPKQLKYLDLRQNHVEYFNVSAFTLWQKFYKNEPHLYLSQNPWQCNCKSKSFLQIAQENYHLIRDLNNMTCSTFNQGNLEKRYIKELTVMDLCQREYKEMIIIIICLIIFLIISILGMFYFKYTEEIKIWLYAHNLCLRFITEEDLDKHKLYDAFISYSHKDEEFISNHLVPQLEGGSNPYKLCIHVRDFEIGRCIPEQIVNCIDNSRRIIVVLSKNFIESQWSRMEFREAQRATLDEGRPRLIIILYSDLQYMNNLDNELKAYLEMNTYLKWGDPWFWDKLRYAMPHRSHSKSYSTLISNV